MKRLLILSAAVSAAVFAVSRKRAVPADLRGRVVIITGASSGIGKATAHAFAAVGARVVLVARREAALGKVQAELARYGVETLVIPADITDDSAAQHVAQETLRAFGRIDVLVNNAGLTLGGPIEEHDPEAMRKLVLLNYYGCARMVQVVLPAMQQQHSGHIVNVGSISGLLLAPGQVFYGGLKAGLIGFSDGLRLEVEDYGVRVSLVLPGWTHTEMVGGMDEIAMRASGLINRFTGGFDAPEKVASGIVNAVRYNRPRVIYGTRFMRAVYLLKTDLMPVLQTTGSRIFYGGLDKQRFIHAHRAMGVPASTGTPSVPHEESVAPGEALPSN